MTSPAYLLPFGVMIVLVGFLLPGPSGDVVETVGILLLVASMYYDVRRWNRRRSNEEKENR